MRALKVSKRLVDGRLDRLRLGVEGREELHHALTEPQTPVALAFFFLVVLAIFGSILAFILESARTPSWTVAVYLVLPVI